MSFRINTNVDAMNAMRNLTTTSNSISQAITHLSTGMRVNSASDDPAGLIISEKFDSQIGGLSQAVENSQEANNYAKTAEGALSEVSKLLKDARSLAVASGNGATLTSSQIQANQSQLQSIVASISRIAKTTQYGTKNLLDGSSGTNSAVTDASKISALSIGGAFGGSAVTTTSTVTINSLTAATQASTSTTSFTSLSAAVSNAGSFTINGVTFSATTANTGGDLVNMINAASTQTGVTASMDSTNGLTLTSSKYGAAAKIDLQDASGTLLGAAGSANVTGTNAVATLALGSTTSLFTGGMNGGDGLTLTDADGNSFSLASSGNVTTSTGYAVGQAVAGSSTFQIGANSGQTAQMSIGNFAASQLGGGAVSGLNLSNLDLTSVAGASNALLVLDKAIDQVSKSRGDIGNFQRNVLESNIRALGTAKENLSSSLSSIRDTDTAAEMTQYTKLQVLQQAGMSVLSQANSAPQQVLNLLKG